MELGISKMKQARRQQAKVQRAGRRGEVQMEIFIFDPLLNARGLRISTAALIRSINLMVLPATSFAGRGGLSENTVVILGYRRAQA